MNDACSPDTADTLPFTPNTPYGRPSWSGLLQFSLVGIPLKAFPAVRTRDVPSAHLLHADCGERIRYAKQCPLHGTVDGAAIVRGYEYGPGRHVDALRPVQDRALRLECFLTPDQLNPLLFRTDQKLLQGVQVHRLDKVGVESRFLDATANVFLAVACHGYQQYICQAQVLAQAPGRFQTIHFRQADVQ